MNIRGANKEDLQQCEEILKIDKFKFSDGSYPNTEFLINYINENYFLVIEDKGEIQGCLVAEPLKTYNIMLWFIAIKKEFRGKGLGKKLISEFEKRCKKRGIGYIVLYCPILNKSSIDFYNKNGYSQDKCFFEFNKEL